MRYRDLKIQTQREAPNNARTEGFSFLVRAGYITRESEILPLGEATIERLRELAGGLGEGFFARVDLPVLKGESGIYFFSPTGAAEIIHCPGCGYTVPATLASFRKTPLPQEEPLPLEKVLTPECNTIDSLATFLGIPKEKTAKALMFTRITDRRFIFAVVRGDMTLSEAKLERLVGEIRLATNEEIAAAGAAPGYASPIGLTKALIVVDELVPYSANLVAGANEAGYHLLNTNCGRDYRVEHVTDLVLAKGGDPCLNCGEPLELLNADVLALQGEIDFKKVLLALAEMHHDGKGLVLQKGAAPYDVYLMQVPGREIDTRAAAEGIYEILVAAGIAVLFDDRDERAGVKFNDADLIGAPFRVTVGERNIRDGMVELKPRKSGENRLIPVDDLPSSIET